MIEQGTKVKVHYTGRTSGKKFDTSEGKDPLEFTVGNKEVIEGFEDAIIGLGIGDKVTTNIAPEKAYGMSRDELIMEVPKDNVPEGIKVGDMLQATNADGKQINVFVNEINETTAVVDANHPLSGKELEFDIEIVEII